MGSAKVLNLLRIPKCTDHHLSLKDVKFNNEIEKQFELFVGIDLCGLWYILTPMVAILKPRLRDATLVEQD